MKPTTNRQELFSNENRLQIGSLIFSLLLIIGGLFWLKSQMELAHTVTNRGYTKDAILNPYLAANKFLNTQGITTENAIDINVIINSLSPNDSIFLLNKRPLRPRQIEKIMPWLSNGGHLIMTPATLWNPNVNSADDDFLNFFGIQYFDQRVQYDFNTSTPNTDNTFNNNKEEPGETLACSPQDQSTPTYIHYDNQGKTISVNFLEHLYLNDNSQSAIFTNTADDPKKPRHILQYPVNEGMLTVLSDHQFLKNTNISWYDHSYFLWMLAGDDITTAWFIFDTDSDNILQLLWKNASQLVICLGVLLGLLLIKKGRRFGPIQPNQSVNRRQIIEHIEASAHFSWNQNQFDHNMAILLNDIHQQLRINHNINGINVDGPDESRRVPELTEQQIEKIAHITQMNKKDVLFAFSPSFEYKEHVVVQRIKLLQQLRNQL